MCGVGSMSSCAYISTGRKYVPNNEVCLLSTNIPSINRKCVSFGIIVSTPENAGRQLQWLNNGVTGTRVELTCMPNSE